MNYADRGKRFVAALIDVLMLWVVNFVINMLIIGSLRGNNYFVAYIPSLLISIGYFVFYQYYMGQTIGKKAMGMRVVDSSGKKPSLGVFALREIIGKWVSALIFGIGYLMILWDPKRQGLHDKIASTYVVKV